jgi:hypothetical protein
MFRRNPAFRVESKPSKNKEKQAAKLNLIPDDVSHVPQGDAVSEVHGVTAHNILFLISCDFLFDLFFYPEDGGHMYLRNVRILRTIRCKNSVL